MRDSARKYLSAGILAAAGMLFSAETMAGQDAPASGGRSHLGEVVFAVSCSAEARAHFDRGIALLYSFGYTPARSAFEKAVLSDPGCAMAFWGIAMTHLHQLWLPPTGQALEAGGAAAERAAELGAPTARERDYIAAIGAFYAHSDQVRMGHVSSVSKRRRA